MRRTITSLSTLAILLMVAVPPALAQEAEGSAKPWHYWIAPFVLGGAVLAIAALFVGYYVRVSRGRR